LSASKSSTRSNREIEMTLTEQQLHTIEKLALMVVLAVVALVRPGAVGTVERTLNEVAPIASAVLR
jgi:hypothetical protein